MLFPKIHQEVKETIAAHMDQERKEHEEQLKKVREEKAQPPEKEIE